MHRQIQVFDLQENVSSWNLFLVKIPLKIDPYCMGILLTKWMVKKEDCVRVGRFSKLIIISHNCRVTLWKSPWYSNNLIKKNSVDLCLFGGFWVWIMNFLLNGEHSFLFFPLQASLWSCLIILKLFHSNLGVISNRARPPINACFVTKSSLSFPEIFGKISCRWKRNWIVP